MPISLDDAFAGAIGREFGAGPSMADQFDRLGRALERRRDPLTRIGLDTFEAIRDMAGQLRKPPWYIIAVRVENLGFLELMAGGSFVFLVLIYLKLEDLWRRLGATNVHLGELTTLASTRNDLLAAMVGCLCREIPGLLTQMIGFMAAILGTLSAYLAAISNIVITHVFDVGPNLLALDLNALIAQVASLLGLLASLGVVAGLASVGLWALGAAAGFAAAGAGFLALVLQAMPDNAAEVVTALAWLTGALALLAIALAVFVGVAAAAGASGNGLVGMIVGVIAAVALLAAMAGALYALPENTWSLVLALMALMYALHRLSKAFADMDNEAVARVVVGLVALGVFLLLTAAAFRVFDETAMQAMQAMPQFLEGLQGLADHLKELDSDAMTRIALGLAGIVAFVFLLGLALRVFPDDAAPALEAMAQVFAQMTLIADKIVELAEGGHMATVAKGLAGVLVFVFLLGLALMLFGEESIQAATAISHLVGALAGLSMALVMLSGVDLWTLVAVFAGLAAVMLAVGLAAAIGGPNLQGLANALTALSTLIETVATNASSLASALNSIPSSISLPSIPGVGSLPGFADGGPVTATGPYMLHAGEHVLNPAETRAMHAGRGPASAGPSISVGAVNVTVNAQSVDEGSVSALGDEIVRRIGDRLAELSREDAFAQGVRSETG